jgi:TniQ
MDWPVLLRPLPRFIAPFRDETINSYLARLATANRLAPAALRALLAGGDRNDAPVPLIRLAAVTGMPGAALAHAMPQICTADELGGLHIASRPRARDGWSVVACRRCTAGRLVTRWALHDDVVCGRHRRWISKYQTQPDLTAQPEILTAHRRHRRLIRRHGRDTVMRAFRDARHICLGWRLDGIPDDGYGRRMEIFHGPGWRDRDDDETCTSDAAAYPQAVALTRLLASPYWRERILGKDWPWPEEFETELPTRAPAGAVTGTTRCSNGDTAPATRNPNRSRRGIPGTCPKPSRPAVAVTSTSITRKLRHDSGQRDIPVP